MVEIPYCEENENVSKHFIKKFEAFINRSYWIAIKWITRKVKSMFKVKSKNPYPSCGIYRGKCSCGEERIGETERNVEKRWTLTVMNITTQQKKLNQQDTCLITLVTCLRGKFRCLLQKTNEHVKTWKCFLLQFKNHHWMSKWSRMFYIFFEAAPHEGHF